MTRGGRRKRRQSVMPLLAVVLVTTGVVAALRMQRSPERPTAARDFLHSTASAYSGASASRSKSAVAGAYRRAVTRPTPPIERGTLEVVLGEGMNPGLLLVDGMRRGAPPVEIDSLTAGPHRVHFLTDAGIVHDSTVRIRAGEATSLVIEPPDAAAGLVSIVSEELHEEGFTEVAGDRVRLDGESAGVTPMTRKLPPGFHSVRVERDGYSPIVSVFKVARGGNRFVRASFGEVESNEIEVLPTLPAPGSRRLVLYATIHGDRQVAGCRMAAHVLHPLREDPIRIAMASVSGTHGEFVAVIDLAELARLEEARYYVEATTPDGETIVSEISPILPPVKATRPARRKADPLAVAAAATSLELKKKAGAPPTEPDSTP